MSRAFTCGPGEVPVVIEKLRRELTEAREALGAARAKLADQTAVELAAALEKSPDQRVVAVLEGAGPESLRAIAARLTSRPEAVVLLAGRAPEGLPVLIARGSGSSFGCGAFLKKPGRGRGRPRRRPSRARRGPPARRCADFPALVAAAARVRSARLSGG